MKQKFRIARVSLVPGFVPDEGYFEVETFLNPFGCYKAAKKETFHLFLLDTAMETKSGIKAGELLLMLKDTPLNQDSYFIALTDTEEEEEIRRLFAYGFDDFIHKLMPPEIVRCKIGSVFRRMGSVPVDGDENISFDDFDFYYDEDAIRFSPTQYKIFRTLFENRGDHLSSSEIFCKCLGKPEKESHTSNIATQILNIRKKLAAAVPGKKLVFSDHSGFWLDLRELQRK